MAKSKFSYAMDRIQRALEPLTKKQGFGRKGRTYNRVTDDGLTQVINFQMGPSDPPAMTYHSGLRENLHGLFTVNLGVYIPELAESGHSDAAKSWVTEAYCSMRMRLGETLGQKHDVWWEAEDRAEVVQRIKSGLEKGGFPFLDRFQTRDEVLNILMNSGDSQSYSFTPPRIICAHILAARGDKTKAAVLLHEQHSGAMKDGKYGHADYVLELIDTLGLTNS